MPADIDEYCRSLAAALADRGRPEGGSSMSSSEFGRHGFPQHGQVGYLELPALDVATSATFYREVFGWSVDEDHASFQAPGLIGQWLADREVAPGAGARLWICADDLYPTLERVLTHGGVVRTAPQLDGGERWLVEIDDPAGNRLGMVVGVGTPQPQTLVTVRDVEASSRWYQRLLGLRSDHGGPDYERLLSGGKLVLQLHQRDVGHHHGRIDDPAAESRGNGVLLWFGDVTDFDDVVVRAGELQAPVVRAPHRNPPAGQGNGPGHRELWISDPDGYTVVVASPDGEAFEPTDSPNR